MNPVAIRLALITGICASAGMTGCITITNTFTGLPPGATPQQSQQMADYRPPQYIYVYPPPAGSDHQYGYDPYQSYPRDYPSDYYGAPYYGSYPPARRRDYDHSPPVASGDRQPRRETPAKENRGGEGAEIERPYEGEIGNDPPSTHRREEERHRTYENGTRNDPPATHTDITMRGDTIRRQPGGMGDRQPSYEQPVRNDPPSSPIDAGQRRRPTPEGPTASRDRKEQQMSRSSGSETPSAARDKGTTGTKTVKATSNTPTLPSAPTPPVAQRRNADVTGPATASGPASGSAQPSATAAQPRKAHEKKDTVTAATETHDRKNEGVTVPAAKPGTNTPAGTSVSGAPRRSVEVSAGAPASGTRQPEAGMTSGAGKTAAPGTEGSPRGGASAPK